jgi:hypothetical protein
MLKALETFALFTCGGELWRISYASDSNPSDYFLSRVWITDQSWVGLTHPFRP